MNVLRRRREGIRLAGRSAEIRRQREAASGSTARPTLPSVGDPGILTRSRPATAAGRTRASQRRQEMVRADNAGPRRVFASASPASTTGRAPVTRVGAEGVGGPPPQVAENGAWRPGGGHGNPTEAAARERRTRYGLQRFVDAKGRKDARLLRRALESARRAQSRATGSALAVPRSPRFGKSPMSQALDDPLARGGSRVLGTPLLGRAAGVLRSTARRHPALSAEQNPRRHRRNQGSKLHDPVPARRTALSSPSVAKPASYAPKARTPTPPTASGHVKVGRTLSEPPPVRE